MILVGTSEHHYPWRDFMIRIAQLHQSFSSILFLTLWSLLYSGTLAWNCGFENFKIEKHPVGRSPSWSASATLVLGYRYSYGLRLQILSHSISFSRPYHCHGYLSYWLRALKEKKHWWVCHMNGYVIACIGNHNGISGDRWPGLCRCLWLFQSPALWIAPGLILGTFSIAGRFWA